MKTDASGSAPNRYGQMAVIMLLGLLPFMTSCHDFGLPVAQDPADFEHPETAPAGYTSALAALLQQEQPVGLAGATRVAGEADDDELVIALVYRDRPTDEFALRYDGATWSIQAIPTLSRIAPSEAGSAPPASGLAAPAASASILLQSGTALLGQSFDAAWQSRGLPFRFPVAGGTTSEAHEWPGNDARAVEWSASTGRRNFVRNDTTWTVELRDWLVCQAGWTACQSAHWLNWNFHFGSSSNPSGAKHVIVNYDYVMVPPDSPPETDPIFLSTINGPNTITQEGQYAWYATATGGTGTFDFTWQINIDGAGWTTVATQQTTGQTSYVRTVDTSKTFGLRVTASSGDALPRTSTITVDASQVNPVQPPPPLNVSIVGPNYAQDSGFYNYQASVSGGDGPYTYQWRVFWGGPGHIYYNTWQTLGTGSTETIWIDQVSGDVTMELTVTSGSQVKTTLLGITNGIGCPEMEC